MATARFKRTLAVRFVANLFIFIGCLAVLFQFGPVMQTELGYRKDLVFGFSHTLSPTVITSGGQGQLVPTPSGSPSSFGALAEGVAEAKGSTPPGQNGNLYIFSHSVDAPWDVARFNAVFYLLRELEAGDKVVIFYQGRRYDYIVFDKQIIDPSNISLLTNRYDKPVLTLQTCDPPGTLLHRLIVRAKLAGT